MTDLDVEHAATRYRGGDSLKVAAAHFAVDLSTLARELRRTGVRIRRRRGWPPST